MALKLYEEEYISLLAQQLRAAQGSETQFLLSELPAGYEAVIEELTSRIFDTSDATAAAEDIAAGKTAYVNGALVEGALTVRSDMDFRTVEADSLGTTGSGNTMWIRMGYEERGDFIARQGTGTTLRKSASAFGDATAADVVSGKTFTSAAGLKVEGTHECAAASKMKVVTVTVESDNTTGAVQQLLTGDAFIKEHYQKDAFFVSVTKTTPIKVGEYQDKKVVVQAYNTNRVIYKNSAGTISTYGRVLYVGSTAANGAAYQNPVKTNADTTGHELCADADGNLYLKSHSSNGISDYPILADDYTVILGVAE